MAIGNYRIATEAARPTHSGTARASKDPARSPDVARMLGQAFANTISDGVSWYKSVQAVGKSLQEIGLDVNDYQSDIMSRELAEKYSKIGVDGNGNQTMTADEWNSRVAKEQAKDREKMDPMQKRTVGDGMESWRSRQYDSLRREEERRRREEERQLEDNTYSGFSADL